MRAWYLLFAFGLAIVVGAFFVGAVALLQYALWALGLVILIVAGAYINVNGRRPES